MPGGCFLVDTDYFAGGTMPRVLKVSSLAVNIFGDNESFSPRFTSAPIDISVTRI